MTNKIQVPGRIANGDKLMRVVQIEVNGVWCGWTDEHGKHREDCYFIHSLRPVELANGIEGRTTNTKRFPKPTDEDTMNPIREREIEEASRRYESEHNDFKEMRMRDNIDGPETPFVPSVPDVWEDESKETPRTNSTTKR